MHLKDNIERLKYDYLWNFFYKDFFRKIIDDLTVFLDHPLSEDKKDALCKHVRWPIIA